MAWAYNRLDRIFIGDSQVLEATLMTADGSALIPQGSITSALFTIVKPSDNPAAPSVLNAAGTITGDGRARYTMTGNDEAGNYRAVARFAYTEGGVARTKSIPVEYDVIDAFARPDATPADEAVSVAWDRLENCFDSDFGGPWLRDMTLSRFDRDTLARFVPDVLLEINTQTPQTDFALASYPFELNDGGALFSTGLFCAAIRHLMVSYTEQPDVMGSQVSHFDRRRYQQAWKSIYDVEWPRYEKLLALFKAKSYNLVNASMLVSNKSGRWRHHGSAHRMRGRMMW